VAWFGQERNVRGRLPSARDTSRTQCSRFSIVQWPWIQEASRAGSACQPGELVIA